MTVKENEDDDTNIMNAGGLSRPQTSGGKPPELARALAEPIHLNGVPLETTVTNGGLSPIHNVPFSTQELEKAISRATLEAPGGVVRGGEITAH